MFMAGKNGDKPNCLTKLENQLSKIYNFEESHLPFKARRRGAAEGKERAMPPLSGPAWPKNIPPRRAGEVNFD